MAELQNGTIPALEKKLTEEKEKSDAEKEDRLLQEEVNEGEIAEVISAWTGIPVA